MELVGLGAAHLNGTLATVTGPLNDRGRWVVTTDEGCNLSARAANLRVVASPAETVGGASAAPAPTAAATDASVATTTAKACFWAARSNEVSDEAAAENRCGRCKRAYYCSRRCQKEHWRHGGHKEACEEPPCCTICLDGGDDPEPIQRGCGCRGDAGLAHVACLAEVAAHKQAGHHEGWSTCPTCGQEYNGAMELGLARELVDRMGTRHRDDLHRLSAAQCLGSALYGAGNFDEAADVLAGVLAAAKRVFGKEHPNTLATATNLAATYSDQGKLAEAEELQGWVLEASRRVSGKEHAVTLAATNSLARTYRGQGRVAEAEVLQVEVLAARRRVHGTEHRDTLSATTSLAATYDSQGKHAEAMVLLEEVLATSRRVLGAMHPDTHLAASNLSITYANLGKHAEAVELRALYTC